MSSAPAVPGVTVVIPTKNRANLLSEAIASVLRVAETVKDAARLEIIVVDDGSTDDTVAVAEALGVRVVPNRGTGVSAARNTGVTLATTEYIGFLDDDDVWLDGHVTQHLAVLESRPEVALVFGQGILADEFLKPVFPPAPSGPLPDGDAFVWALTNCIQVNTMIVRREVLLEGGGFKEGLVRSQDWELELRLASRFDFVGLEIPVSLYRQAAGRLTSARDWTHSLELTLDILRRGSRLPARVPVPRRTRLTLTFGIRGWHAARFLFAAQDCLGAGKRREAARCLLGALRASPLHALLRLPGYWTTALRLVPSAVKLWLPSLRSQTRSRPD